MMCDYRFARPGHPFACVQVEGADKHEKGRTCDTDPAHIQQAQRLMQVGCMAAGIAHDINNLLTVIEGSVGLASEALPADHVAQHDLAAISQASRRSSAMLRQMLGFIRQQPAQPFPINLGETLRSLNLLIERIFGQRVAVLFDIAPDLWLISAVHSQIEQVLINLLTNARDAMPEGGQVTISARNYIDQAGGAYVLLEVADTGGGVAAEMAPLLFAPFYTTKEPGKGAGLGLSVCGAIVDQLGGRITLESAPGQGTAVRIILPRAQI